MSLASARFHPLPIAACAPEGEDALSVGFAIPESLRAGFGFLPGQHLTLRAMIDGVEQRRSYSICSGPGEALLRIGIRCLPGGAFSSHARATWRVGRCVDVMPPAGRFVFTPDPAATGRYLAIVAGSGITPVLAILKAALAAEPGSRFTLLYGNRSLASTMFRQELADLKDRYLDRLSLFLLFSREAQDVAGLNGRLDAPYESKHIREMLKRTVILRYNETTDITRDMRLTLYNAGHILGSSSVHLHIGDGLYNIVLSGDVKFEKSWLFNPANNKFPRVETFMTESTYAGRDDYFYTRTDASNTLIDIVNRTFDRGGSVVVPVFAVGRSQEVMLVLEQAMREGMIKNVPVYVDGMIMEATAIHAAYPEFLNKNLRENIMIKGENPFLSPIFKKVETREQRQNICDSVDNQIVLATSGMMNGGPVMEYFKSWCESPKHSLVFVGYQADGTLGRRIQRGAKEISLSDGGKLTRFQINMSIEVAEGFSGHSDKKQLLAYIATMQPKPHRILVNHGDGEKCYEFAKLIRNKFGIEGIALKNLETVRVY